ncbi:MAG: sigma-54-dependent Fis family transcriptional regulator [Planctomycetes bacterium]|nr:sigma-54-dependent Fis family transcriptional regulator [Planctomycetota bacterium]
MSNQSRDWKGSSRGTVLVGGGDSRLSAQFGACGFLVRAVEDRLSAEDALDEVDLVVLNSAWPHATALAGTCAARGGPPVLWSQSAELQEAKSPPRDVHARLGIVGSSPALLTALERISWAAPSKATVLLEGESGTGKESLAALVHALSGRSGPLIKVNCASLAPGVLESELFGHERGAFTGAIQQRKGRFELACGGTLLLDEVSEVSTDVQAKLLRVLEEEELERVGGSETVSLDVRIVASTNRDLRAEVKHGRFREDLYFRLAVFPISVPPLRDRKGDLAALVEHFVARFGHESAARGFTPAALEFLSSHHWPGNVRELENLVRRALLLGGSTWITPERLRAELTPSLGQGLRPVTGLECRGPDLAVRIRELERTAIASALVEAEGNRAGAARLLGISVRTLYNRLKRYQADGAPLLSPQ